MSDKDRAKPTGFKVSPCLFDDGHSLVSFVLIEIRWSGGELTDLHVPSELVTFIAEDMIKRQDEIERDRALIKSGKAKAYAS